MNSPLSSPLPTPNKASSENVALKAAFSAGALQHIGIIMDGNRRWAKQRNMLAQKGHWHGFKTFKQLAFYANDLGLPYLTAYAFSTENWKRSQREVSYLLALMSRVITKEAQELIDDNIKIKIIGDYAAFPKKLATAFENVMTASEQNTGLTLQIALNYGGRSELVHAVQELSTEVAAGRLTPADITEKHIEQRLYTVGSPDTDLIIRTGGEQRLSNFLTWQSTYAEYWFTDTLWPDFSPAHFEAAIEDYLDRSRRFGK